MGQSDPFLTQLIKNKVFNREQVNLVPGLELGWSIYWEKIMGSHYISPIKIRGKSIKIEIQDFGDLS